MVVVTVVEIVQILSNCGTDLNLSKSSRTWKLRKFSVLVIGASDEQRV